MSDPYVSPLILTLTLDAGTQAWFDARRDAYFPPDRLVVGAHVTMFHALPGARGAELAACLAELATRTVPFPVQVLGVRSLGYGVAYRLSAPDAGTVRARIASRFAGDLSPQDRAAWSPHITVQNKVTSAVARRTLALLSAEAMPSRAAAQGLALWWYRGGPWEPFGAWPFAAACDTGAA